MLTLSLTLSGAKGKRKHPCIFFPRNHPAQRETNTGILPFGIASEQARLTPQDDGGSGLGLSALHQKSGEKCRLKRFATFYRYCLCAAKRVCPCGQHLALEFTLLLFSSLAAFAAPHRPAPIIVCFGDSITAGYGVEPGHSYPDYLQGALDARGYHYRVINQGISGNTTKDGLDRLDHVLSLHPAVVIVEFAGNDGLRGLPIGVTRANLDKIVAALVESGSKVLLAGVTLPPNYGRDYIEQFDAIYPAVAAKYHVPLLPTLYAGVYTVPGAIQDDGIHPTAKGAQLIASHLLPRLLPLLSR